MKDLFKKSVEVSNLLPSLLSDSSLLLKNILVGLHSARFPGKGENFWQFKEYTQGESINSIGGEIKTWEKNTRV